MKSQVGLGFAAWALLMPGLAWGEDTKICVDSSATVTDWSWCFSDPCDATVASLNDAADAITSIGLGPTANHLVCVGSPGAHIESPVLDASTGDLGFEIVLFWADGPGTNYCPDDSGPGISLLGGGGAPFELSIFGLRTSGDDCAQSADPLLSLSNVTLSFSSASVRQQTGAILTGTGGGDWLVSDSMFSGLSAPLLTGDRNVSFSETEISGSSLVAQPLLSGGWLSFGDVSVHGNVTNGAPLLSAERMTFNSGLLAQNVGIGSSLLVVEQAIGGPAQTLQLNESEVGGNVLLAPGGSATPIATPVAHGAPILGTPSCAPSGSQNQDFASRGSIVWSGTPSDSAVFDVSSLGTSPTSLKAQRNLVASNTTSPSGALFRGGSLGVSSRVSLFHNTIEAQSGLVLDMPDSSGGSRIYSARNLLLGSPGLSVGAGVTFVEVTMDQLEDSASSWVTTSSQLPGIAGPFPQLVPWGTSSAFMNSTDVLALTYCPRIQLMCPEILDCSVWFLDPVCPIADEGASLVPSVTSTAAAAAPWPWQTSPWGTGASDMVGPTGWLCGGNAIFYGDEDSDGYSALVDCDDQNSAVVPVRPDPDGYSSAECGVGTCFVCPPGSIPVGDDDDSGDDDDDDDATANDDDATANDDDATANDDDATANDDDVAANDDDVAANDDDSGVISDDDAVGAPTAPLGCSRAGCGTTLPVSAMLLAPLFGVRRRREMD